MATRVTVPAVRSRKVAAGAAPLAGDWNQDGADTVGVYVAASQTVLLRNENAGGEPDVTFALAAPAGAAPVAGDWDYNPKVAAKALKQNVSATNSAVNAAKSASSGSDAAVAGAVSPVTRLEDDNVDVYSDIVGDAPRAIQDDIAPGSFSPSWRICPPLSSL